MKNTIIEIACLYCKSEFAPSRQAQVYCCKSCKEKSRLKRNGVNYTDTLRKKYRSFKKQICNSCGFKALNLCQMDIDHIDGNKKNLTPDNIQTLCANCHRLKTWQNNEHVKRY